MLEETKIYWVKIPENEKYETPSDEDIKECIEICTNEHVTVHLHWFGPDNYYYGGYHNLFIRPGDDFDKIKGRLPKSYGL